ncbi:hypothetical protein D3C81_1938720 [compost metagenome]
MQTHFMTGITGLTHQVPEIAANRLARPRGAGEQNVPAVQAGRIGAEHFPEKLRADQTPQMPAHVVGADTEEERCLDLRLVEHFQQARHTFTGAAKGVDVDA